MPEPPPGWHRAGWSCNIAEALWGVEAPCPPVPVPAGMGVRCQPGRGGAEPVGEPRRLGWCWETRHCSPEVGSPPWMRCDGDVSGIKSVLKGLEIGERVKRGPGGFGGRGRCSEHLYVLKAGCVSGLMSSLYLGCANATHPPSSPVSEST